MGLTHPGDLAAWRRDHERRHPLRALRGRLRPGIPAGVLTRGGPDADLLVVLDATSPSNRAALLAPVAHLPAERVVVLAPAGLAGELGAGWSEETWSGGPLPRASAILSAGHYLPLGAAAHEHARALDVAAYVVQHGLLTPANPPLPPGATALAWSGADAAFWASGRTDLRTEVVGSQLLHEAATLPRASPTDGPPTYLGQLHGAELPRRAMAAAAGAFCLRTGATYRPHPSERDRASRRQHARWQAVGITLDRSGTPLASLTTGVVSVFSTGVLEAAARGLPAWVDLLDPPPWLRDFWSRYDMRPWGGEPTPAPAVHDLSPAARVAAIMEGTR